MSKWFQPTVPQRTPSKFIPGFLLFFGILLIYHSNGDFLIGHDATGNTYLPISLIRRGSFTFTPEEMPFMFVFQIPTAKGPQPIQIGSWKGTLGKWSKEQLYKQGVLKVTDAMYYIVPAKQSGSYVNYFGPGSGLTALPFFLLLDLFSDQLEFNPKLMWYGGKFVASACVAGAALFVFLTASLFLSRARALLLAVAFSLGTCVWSMSSQQLYQHGPNEFFLALGFYSLFKAQEKINFSLLCGAALAWAAVCRPTSALVAGTIGAYLLVSDRRRFWRLAVAALPIALLFAYYNQHYLGSPIDFGQTMGAKRIALVKTGSDHLWQTPLWLGAAGMLVSPSRGLFIYSPFLLFSFLCVSSIWKDRTWHTLRPVFLCVLIVWGVEFKHFDWWSGWSFGYRHLVDSTVMLALLLIPFLAGPFEKRIVRGIFVALLTWSIFVQFLGAFAYDLSGWNARTGYKIQVPGEEHSTVFLEEPEAAAWSQQVNAPYQTVSLDIDRKENRSRLWSVRDSQIVYYLTHFQQARRLKKKGMEQWCNGMLQ